MLPLTKIKKGRKRKILGKCKGLLQHIFCTYPVILDVL